VIGGIEVVFEEQYKQSLNKSLPHAPFSKLQALPPPEAKPISLWLNRDEAWLEVVKKIEAVALDLLETEQRHSPDNVTLLLA
jgi:hypothetical protein